jgi:hypothetical protein
MIRNWRHQLMHHLVAAPKPFSKSPPRVQLVTSTVRHTIALAFHPPRPPHWWHRSRSTPQEKREKRGEGRKGKKEGGMRRSRRCRPSSPEKKMPGFLFFATGLHCTASRLHDINSPCTGIPSPSPPMVRSPPLLARHRLCLTWYSLAFSILRAS